MQVADSHDCGFDRSRRLTRSSQFQRVFSDNIRVSDVYWTLLAKPRRKGDGSRLGLAISKKNAPRAVDRNRLKRLVRESFRLNRDQLDSLDLVVMARRASAEADNLVLLASLGRLWKKLASRCENRLKN